MKSNYKFYLGLSFGLFIGFILFNFSPAFSSSTTNVNLSNQSSGNPSVDGSWEPLCDMQGQINAYSAFVSENNLPSNTSTGGYIKRTVLNDITGTMDGTYIKYSFYYDGNGKIGLYFQKQGDPNNGIRTGASAFCPNLCEYPN